MKNILHFAFYCAFVVIPQLINAQVTDINGQTYKTVFIGSQTWMAENLNVDRFRNGDAIPEVKTDEEWKTACRNFQPAWCYYKNDPKNAAKFGKLYNFWAVIDSRGIAPEGWTVPSDDDLNKLKNSVGTYKLSEVELGAKPIFKTEVTYNKIPAHPEEKYVSCSNCSYWTKEQKKYNPCTKCKNNGYYYVKTGKTIPEKTEKIEKKILLSGFENGQDKVGLNIMPSGKRTNEGFSGAHDAFGKSGYLWSSDFFQESDYGNAFGIGHELGFYDHNYTQGFSIRCVKGENNSDKRAEISRKYEFAIHPIQYLNFYSKEIIPSLGNYVNQLFETQNELNFISVKTDFICTTTYCCGFLEYIYSGIDGKDNIVGYKISKSSNTQGLNLSIFSASTSRYDQSSESYGPITMNKISDFLYETVDGKYKVLFQFTNIHCEPSTPELSENFHIKVTDNQKEFYNTLIGYQMSWLESIGGAHWSGGSTSSSGHNQNWALGQVMEYLKPNQIELKSKKSDSIASPKNQDSSKQAIENKTQISTRTRLNNVSLPRYEIDYDCKVSFKLNIDASGTVVDVFINNSITTCLNENMIEDIKKRIKRELKYNLLAGAEIMEINYTISLKAN